MLFFFSLLSPWAFIERSSTWNHLDEIILAVQLIFSGRKLHTNTIWAWLCSPRKPTRHGSRHLFPLQGMINAFSQSSQFSWIMSIQFRSMNTQIIRVDNNIFRRQGRFKFMIKKEYELKVTKGSMPFVKHAEGCLLFPIHFDAMEGASPCAAITLQRQQQARWWTKVTLTIISFLLHVQDS